MLGHITKITSSFYKIQMQYYSKFTVTVQESVFDTSKTSHPGLLKQECGTPICNEKNYQYKQRKTIEVTDNIRMQKKDPMKAYTDYDNASEVSQLANAMVENIDSLVGEDMVQTEIHEPVIVVVLKPNVSGDTKHVNVGELNKDGQGITVYGALTSSSDSDPKTGKATTFKIFAIKMDGSFIKEPFSGLNI